MDAGIGFGITTLAREELNPLLVHVENPSPTGFLDSRNFHQHRIGWGRDLRMGKTPSLNLRITRTGSNQGLKSSHFWNALGIPKETLIVNDLLDGSFDFLY